MAHEKCFAICESKSHVETLSKDQINKRVSPVISDETDLDVNGCLYLRCEQNVTEKVYNNKLNPTKTYINFDNSEESPYFNGLYQHCYFRFNKAMGTSSSPSSFIQLSPAITGYTIKYLNNSINITNYTRVFVEVFIDNHTIYVGVSGC